MTAHVATPVGCYWPRIVGGPPVRRGPASARLARDVRGWC